MWWNGVEWGGMGVGGWFAPIGQQLGGTSESNTLLGTNVTMILLFALSFYTIPTDANERAASEPLVTRWPRRGELNRR